MSVFPLRVQSQTLDVSAARMLPALRRSGFAASRRVLPELGVEIKQETAADSDEVEWLFDLAFAPGRHALSSYRLREGVAPVAALRRVARDDHGVLAGAIRFWPVTVGEDRAPALLLGPVAVHPTRQGEGIGALLIGDALEIAADAGWTRVILIGDEPYYRRFGFTREAAKDLTFPPPTNPDRVLARALRDGAWDEVRGKVRRMSPAGDGGD